jgi:uncharacterized protein YciI
VGNPARRAHLDAGQGSAQGKLVEVAEVADAEDLALQLREAVAERHVEVLQHHLAEGVGIVAVRHAHGGQHAAVLALVQALDLEAPGAHRPAGRLAVAGMAGKDVLHPLLHQHGNRLLETVKQVGGRRIRRIGKLEATFLPFPIGVQKTAFFDGQGLPADRVETEPGGSSGRSASSRR